MDFTEDMLEEEDGSIFLSLMKIERMMMGWMILMWKLKSFERLNTLHRERSKSLITELKR